MVGTLTYADHKLARFLSMGAGVPASLEPLRAYFERAAELEATHPFESHYISLFALTLALKQQHADAGAFLLESMEKLEAQKNGLKPPKIADPSYKPPAPEPDLPAQSPAAATPAAAATSAAEAPSASDALAESTADANGLADAEAATEVVATGEEKKSWLPRNKLKTNTTKPAQLAKETPLPVVPLVPAIDATPAQALRILGLDLYNRSRAADQPNDYPSPGTKWGQTGAPRVAGCLPAGAVVFDAIKQFDDPLPSELAKLQAAAYRRSQQLGQKIESAFKMNAPIPMDWRPVDMSAPPRTAPRPTPHPKPPPGHATPDPIFPSAPH